MTTTEKIGASDSTAAKVQVLDLIDVNCNENYLLFNCWLSKYRVLKLLCKSSSLILRLDYFCEMNVMKKSFETIIIREADSFFLIISFDFWISELYNASSVDLIT